MSLHWLQISSDLHVVPFCPPFWAGGVSLCAAHRSPLPVPPHTHHALCCTALGANRFISAACSSFASSNALDLSIYGLSFLKYFSILDHMGDCYATFYTIGMFGKLRYENLCCFFFSISLLSIFPRFRFDFSLVILLIKIAVFVFDVAL